MIPIELIFNPNWWHLNDGICFDESFYMHLQKRIDNDFEMRTYLFKRFDIGNNPIKREPVIGSTLVAGGFVLPALFGVSIEFFENEAPWPTGQPMNDSEILALEPPNIKETWPISSLLKDAAQLIDKYGYVVGDFDLDGIFNTALHLRGQQLFMDLIEKPALTNHLFSVLAQTYISIVKLMRKLTKTCALSTNRSIINVSPEIFLHSNCSVSMISPKIYKEQVFPHEMNLAIELQPYGIHHCGDNMHLFSEIYNQIPSQFFDVGWGSDINKCSQVFSEAFLNLRLSPVRLLQCSSEEIYEDTRSLLEKSKRMANVGVCCINMDAGTPDENVRTIYRAVEDYEQSNQKR